MIRSLSRFFTTQMIKAEAHPSPSSNMTKLNPSLQKSLSLYLNHSTPSPFQTQVMEVLLSGKNLFAKTGNRFQDEKMLSYVVPIVDYLMKSPPNMQAGYPRAIIFCEYPEEISQVEALISKLSPQVNRYSLLASDSLETQKAKLQASPIDLLIAQPTRLLDFVDTHVIKRKLLHFVVCGDMDTLMEKHLKDMYYFFAQVELMLEFGLKLNRNVNVHELEQPPNTFQTLFFLNKLTLLNMETDFAKYLSRSLVLLDLTKKKKETKSASPKRKQVPA